MFRRLGDLSHGVIAQTSSFMILYYSGSLSVNQIIQILMSHMQRLHCTSLLLPLTLQLRVRLNFRWERSKLRVWMYDQCLWKQDIKDFHLPDQPVNILRNIVIPPGLIPRVSHNRSHPTSRWQTITSLWSLDYYNSVIPTVPFIWWSNNFSFKIFGSLKPTFRLRLIYKSYDLANISTFMLKNKIFCLSLPFVHLSYYL